MKFKMKRGNLIFVAGRLISFKGGEYETNDKSEIEALEKANDVEKIVSKREKAPD